MRTRSSSTVLVLAMALVGACSSCEEQPSAAGPSEVETADSPRTTQWADLDPPVGNGALGLDLSVGDAVTATWLEPRGDGHAVRTATLRAETWSAASTVTEDARLVANWADFPRSVRGGDGSLYVYAPLRAGDSPYAYAAHLFRSRGDTFEALGAMHTDPSPTEHGFVSMVPTADGARLFWLDGRAQMDEGPTALYSATVADGAIEGETQVDPRVCDCCQTDATMAGGEALVVYRDRDSEEHRDIAVARGSGPGSTLHEDGWQIAGCPVNGPAVDGEGERVVVAWFTGADGGSVRAAFSDDGGRSYGEPKVVDPDQPPGRVGVALVEDGAVVSWLARTHEGGEVRTRFVSPEALGPPTVVGRTSTDRDAGFPVMVRDGARLLVGFRDTRSGLRVRALPVAEVPRAGQAHVAEAPVLAAAGDPLPEGDVRDETDALVSVDELSGERPLVLAVFARWCQPCREELAMLETLRTERGETIDVVALSLDEGSHERAVAVARRWGFGGAVYRDAGLAASLGVPPLPGLFIAEAGVLRAVWRGAPAELDAVRPHLRSSAGP